MSETPQGYSGPLPPYYVQSSTPQTPNVGFTIAGMDPILAYNFVLADTAIGSGGGGGSVKVNGSTVTNPNFNNTTPTNPFGGPLVTWQVSGSNVSAILTGLYFVNGVPFSGDGTTIDFANGSNITLTDAGSGQLQFAFSGVLPQNTPAITHDFITAYNATTGAFTQAQPSFSDISGTITPNTQFAAQLANVVLAGPTSGGSAGPTFRALVTADMPAGTGTVTSFSAGNLSPLFTTSVATATTTPALTFALSNAAGGTLFGNNTTSSAAPVYTTAPVLGIPGTSTGTIALASSTASGKYTLTAPANAATPTLTLPTTSNVLAGQFAGDGTVLSATLAVASAAGTVTASLANAAGGTVLANNTTGSATPTYTIAPVLGIPGTSTGTIALASTTASGKFTITAPASSATPTLTLPTTTNVLAGQLAGDGTVFSSSLVTASAAGTITLPTPQNQTANTVFAGPTSGGAAAPTFRAIVAADIPSGTVVWNNIGNATGALTLANAGNATTFNQTSAVNWTWANTTAATSGTSQSSPIVNINGTYWTGAASATDSWTVQDVVGNGTNGTSTLTFAHSGTSGSATISLANLLTTTGGITATSGAFTWNVNAACSFGGAVTAGVILTVNENAASNVALMVKQAASASGDAFQVRPNGSSTPNYSISSAAIVTKYNNTTTVANGQPYVIALADQTAQSAAITATNLTASAPQTGRYRVSFAATITTAATTSSVLGGTNGFQVVYTSPTDSVVKTTVPGNSVTSAANTTGTAIADTLMIHAKTGTAIQYQFDYTSVGATAMQYEIHVTLEAM